MRARAVTVPVSLGDWAYFCPYCGELTIDPSSIAQADVCYCSPDCYEADIARKELLDPAPTRGEFYTPHRQTHRGGPLPPLHNYRFKSA